MTYSGIFALTACTALLIFNACTPVENDSLPSEVFTFGEQELELNTIKKISNLDIENLGYPMYLQAGTDSNLIITDSKPWQILLVSQTGVLLDKTGGAGQGPGEFGVINLVHVNGNDQLITLDKRLGRVGLFNIQDNRLSFEKNIRYQSPDSLILQDIYSDGENWFGVYESRNHSSHSLFLYSLNNDLTPETKLLEMPGHERTEIMGREVTNNFGKTTHWAFQGPTLYYGSSHCFCLTSFNLNTFYQDSISYVTGARSKATETFKTYAKDRMAPVIQAYPEWEDVIDELTTLPLHSGLSVNEEYVLFYPFSTAQMRIRL